MAQPPLDHISLLGDVDRSDAWQSPESPYWLGVGDTRLDLRAATLPVGDTTLRLRGFVGDVKVRVPPEVALSISSSAMITDADISGEKHDYIFTPFTWATPGYAEAERRLHLELIYFVVDLDIETVA